MPGLAIAVRSLEPNREAIPRGQHRPSPSPGQEVLEWGSWGRGVLGDSTDSSLAQLSQGFPGGQQRSLPTQLSWGAPRGDNTDPTDPALQGEDRKKGRGREAVLGETPPSRPHSPTQEGRGMEGDPQPGNPRGIRPAAGGARSQARPGGGRPGVPAGDRYSPARTSWPPLP